MLDETTLEERQRSAASVRAYTDSKSSRTVRTGWSIGSTAQRGTESRGSARGMDVQSGAWCRESRTYVHGFELHLAEEQWGLHAGKREGNVPSGQSAESERAHAGEKGPTYEVNPRKNTVTSPKTYPHSATTPGSRQSTMARPRQSPQIR